MPTLPACGALHGPSRQPKAFAPPGPYRALATKVSAASRRRRVDTVTSPVAAVSPAVAPEAPPISSNGRRAVPLPRRHDAPPRGSFVPASPWPLSVASGRSSRSSTIPDDERRGSNPWLSVSECSRPILLLRVRPRSVASQTCRPGPSDAARLAAFMRPTASTPVMAERVVPITPCAPPCASAGRGATAFDPVPVSPAADPNGPRGRRPCRAKGAAADPANGRGAACTPRPGRTGRRTPARPDPAGLGFTKRPEPAGSAGLPPSLSGRRGPCARPGGPQGERAAPVPPAGVERGLGPL